MSTQTTQASPPHTHGLKLPMRLDLGDPTPVPFARLVRMELRKLVDTRAGRWLLLAIALVTATVVVIVMFTGQPGSGKDFSDFLMATVIPQNILLPVLGIMAVTSEWSQRTGLVTFTLEPRRSRVGWSKMVAASVMGLAAVATAFVLAVGATLLTEVLRGSDPAWWGDGAWQGMCGLVVMQLIGVATGVAFGMLIQNTPGAIVAYLFIPTVWSMVSSISWMQTVGDWADTSRTMQPLLEGEIAGIEWAQLLVSIVIWVVVPLAGGMWRVVHSEVKSA